jgi:ABC-type microcin C transport system permease subunit YejB
MNDSFKEELEKIKAEAPTKVKADPGSLLYGIIFVALGGFLFSLGATGIGAAMVLVGAVGVIAGLATFVWKSPKVKIIQAIDSFLMAILLAVLAMTGGGGGDFFDNPLIGFGLAAFMLWAGYDDLKEYRQLSAVEAERSRIHSPQSGA